MSPGRAPSPPPPARTARELREAATAARRRARSDSDVNPLRQTLVGDLARAELQEAGLETRRNSLAGMLATVTLT